MELGDPRSNSNDFDTGDFPSSSVLPIRSVPGSLAHTVASHRLPVCLTFGGQGTLCLDELAAAYNQEPAVRPLVDAASAHLEAMVAQEHFLQSGLYGHGLTLTRWLRDPSSRPSTDYLVQSAISQPMVFITQITRYHLAWRAGLADAFASGAVVAATGHSQGLLAALLVAECEGGAISIDRFLHHLSWLAWQGFHMANAWPDGDREGKPMAAISGVDQRWVDQALEQINPTVDASRRAAIALHNARTRFVIAGPGPTLQAVRKRLTALIHGAADDTKAGRRPNLPLPPKSGFTWEDLPVSVAFHTAHMADGAEGMLRSLHNQGLHLSADRLRIDVPCSSGRGSCRDVDDLTRFVVETQFTEPVRWFPTIRTMCGRWAPSWILDLGPSDGVARLTRSCVRGTGAAVIAMATPEGQTAWSTSGAQIPQARNWSRLAPTLVQLDDGSTRIENRYTLATGDAPVILPGMTPTTADVPIVAAAANAGFTAEIAGGGQPSAVIFDERVRELKERLDPGREVVFNALYLDRYLWDLHLGRKKLVQTARRNGAPIRGVTITAGIPEVDEAVALLHELNGLGMWHNAFKPGTDAQVKSVLRIAAAVPEYTLFLHLEGGRAGGHHSWDGLDELLLRNYAAIRDVDNVVLCVGGGVADEERAVALLSGTWAHHHDMPTMPVDAVFLGTIAMATAEARTSQSVKRALAHTAGVDGWVHTHDTDGGMTSGKSGLNADIHYIDNRAARCARLLDEVAGKAEAVALRRADLICALNETAKPYFGDIEVMSWSAVLGRMIALMASGTPDRYTDGRWADVTWRQRVADVVHRAEARLCDADEGTFTSILGDIDDLHEPHAVITRLMEAFPEARSRKLHPADVTWFVDQVCARPGKPVPFVPVIDENVRRWYASDSLWQSHDDRYDADQVLVIPGPTALRGIKKPNEPVAELLARFDHALLEQVNETAGVSARVDRLRRPNLPTTARRASQGSDVQLTTGHDATPLCLINALGGFSGPLGEFVASETVNLGARRIINPLRKTWLSGPNTLVQGRITRILSGERLDRAVFTTDSATSTLSFNPETDRVELDLDGLALSFDLIRSTGITAFVIPPERWGKAISAFYHHTLFGDALPETPLFGTASHRTHVDRERLSGWSRHVGAPLISAKARTTTSSAPQPPADHALMLAWKPVFQVLSHPKLATDLLDLVHLNHEVEITDAWPRHDTAGLTAHATITRVDADATGRTVDVLVTLTHQGDVAARLHEQFRLRVAPDTQGRRAEAPSVLPLNIATEADAAFLAQHEWLCLDETVAVGDVLVLEATLREDPASGASATGVVTRNGAPIGTVALQPTACPEHPVRVLADLLAPEASTKSTPRRTLATGSVTAPSDLTGYAAASGDRNPIHWSTIAARLAGFEGPVVHGMWTSASMQAFATHHLANSQNHRLRSWNIQFLAPVQPGSELQFTATRTGVDSGSLVVEIAASVDGAPVARATAVIAPPLTAYVFPGQGIQRPGMGMDLYASSRAARAVWDRADTYTRAHLGFSILQVVQDNPKSILLDRAIVRHRQGVLHRTRFTQVAMAVLAYAQTMALREAGVLAPNAVTAGHSVGEYNALAAIGEVLPLEAVVDLVWHRGGAMEQLVERDEDGETGFRMSAIRPNVVGLTEADLRDLITEVRTETGAFVEVVNFNVRDRQYAVTGEFSGIDRLHAELDALTAPGGRKAYVQVPGIDIPFHSTCLRGGVDAFRATLDRVFPAEIRWKRLINRYVPNLIARPFDLEKHTVQRVADLTDSAIAARILCDYDRWAADPNRLARTLLIEMLAWQFASPVRWIESQEVILSPAELGVERVVEIGLGQSPTLRNMARHTLNGWSGVTPQVDLVHLEADSARVWHNDDDPAPVARETAGPPSTAPAPASVAPTAAAAAPVSTSPAVDSAVDLTTALYALLALQARVRPSQIAADESIDDLFDGVSSRRNQALMDIGAEFGLATLDAAHERPIKQLAAELEKSAPSWRFPGKYLQGALTEAVKRTLAPAGMTESDVRKWAGDEFGLPNGLQDHILLSLALDTRDGNSGRGGALGDLKPATDRASAESAIEGAVAQVAKQTGQQLGRQAAAGTSAAVDATVVNELREAVLGADGALMTVARTIGTHLGHAEGPAPLVSPTVDVDRARLATLDAEYGADHADRVKGVFDSARHVAFTSWWAWARRDAADVGAAAANGTLVGEALSDAVSRLRRPGQDPTVARILSWYAGQADQNGFTDAAAALSTESTPGWLPAPEWITALDVPEIASSAELLLNGTWSLAGQTALVTGAGPGSIAEAMVQRLLAAGARVVVTTSNPNRSRVARYRLMYQDYAGPGAELHVVPFNQASAVDADRLVDWVMTRRTEQDGAITRVVKEAWTPDLLVPFAAPKDRGTLDTVDGASEAALRAMLLGVERLIAGIGSRKIAQGVGSPCHVVVPLSPNHGTFGGDGTYGESKAALEVLRHRWRSEAQTWGRGVTLCNARIGWVRGTGLMGGNDPAASKLEEDSIRTFSNDEMALALCALSTEASRLIATVGPIDVDLTGGLGDCDDLSDRLASVREALDATSRLRRRKGELNRQWRGRATAQARVFKVHALPDLVHADEQAIAWPEVNIDPTGVVVIVGAGEVGPLGSSRTRFELEIGESLSAAAVLELAWITGLVHHDGKHWIDTDSSDTVEEHAIATRYREAVRSRVGVRFTEPETAGFDPEDQTVLETVYLDRDFAFPVATRAEAESFRGADPDHTVITETSTGFMVTRTAGAQMRVPRQIRLSRRVAGQVPRGFDPRRYGVPEDLVERVDRVTLFNLVATVEAFLGAGLTPEELMRHVHPARVGNTQGTGIGGMGSLKRLYLDPVLGNDQQSDILQESLANVVAAYVVQSYVGSYGPMSHPVGACATAAVSVDDGVDKILAGKADFVVAGGFDDLGAAGVQGFGAMNATAETDLMLSMGLEPDQMSRPGDARRRGFVESQGGGTILLARADVALNLGLDVLGVVAWSGSFGDGVHRSIPAPGQGALSAVMGGASSPVAAALRSWGLTADDIGVVSKHDTSTTANDPNEHHLHHNIQQGLGRTPGNPLRVISQKSATGHSKGGAAAWQAIGLCQALSSGVIPPNHNLDSVDDVLREPDHLVVSDRPGRVGPLRAGLLTSLGFGHVSAAVMLLHPAAFTALLTPEQFAIWTARRDQRRTAAQRDLANVMLGRQQAFVPRTHRRFEAADGSAEQKAQEALLLANPNARLGADGIYRSTDDA